MYGETGSLQSTHADISIYNSMYAYRDAMPKRSFIRHCDAELVLLCTLRGSTLGMELSMDRV
jgi:hypothetical protein